MSATPRWWCGSRSRPGHDRRASSLAVCVALAVGCLETLGPDVGRSPARGRMAPPAPATRIRDRGQLPGDVVDGVFRRGKCNSCHTGDGSGARQSGLDSVELHLARTGGAPARARRSSSTAIRAAASSSRRSRPRRRSVDGCPTTALRTCPPRTSRSCGTGSRRGHVTTERRLAAGLGLAMALVVAIGAASRAEPPATPTPAPTEPPDAAVDPEPAAGGAAPIALPVAPPVPWSRPSRPSHPHRSQRGSCSPARCSSTTSPSPASSHARRDSRSTAPPSSFAQARRRLHRRRLGERQGLLRLPRFRGRHGLLRPARRRPAQLPGRPLHPVVRRASRCATIPPTTAPATSRCPTTWAACCDCASGT